MQTPMEELEAFVDKWGLKGTINGLADIAYSKAMHIEENWQDMALAKTWKSDANRLYSAGKKTLNGATRFLPESGEGR